MTQIEHVINPDRLLLVWRSNQAGASRTRRVVAELVTNDVADDATLRYLVDSVDFENATKDGFKGYPAFSLKNAEHKQNVLGSFLRRLPPRKRDDFQTYLIRYGIPPSVRVSDMALLAYTNAKLPSDGFELVADLRRAKPPFELVIEVAGFRHQETASVDDIYVGDPVMLKAESENSHDQNAVALYHSGTRIGYVDRAQAPSFLSWFSRSYNVQATVERINGTADRPQIHLFVTVR